MLKGRRKPLLGVAHSVAHSFVSPMNYGSDGYVIEELVNVAVVKNEETLEVNLLTGEAKPKVLLPAGIRTAVKRYVESFPGLVESSGSSMRFVKDARLKVTIDLRKPRQTHWLPAAFHYSVICVVTIRADSGRQYVRELGEFWPGPLPRPRLVSRKAAT